MTPEAFLDFCTTEDWQPPMDKSYGANDVPPMHTHDFDATVLITAGELRMAYEDRVEVLGAGDHCVVPAGTMHSEQVGPDGALGLLATRPTRS